MPNSNAAITNYEYFKMKKWQFLQLHVNFLLRDLQDKTKNDKLTYIHKSKIFSISLWIEILVKKFKHF